MRALTACGGDEATETTFGATETTPESVETTVEETVTSVAAEAIDEALLGKWFSEATGETLEFTAEGIMRVSSETDEGSYELSYTSDGSEIVVSDGTMEVPAAYTVDGDKLSLFDPEQGAMVEYTRLAE